MFGDILESALDLIDELNLRYGLLAENAAFFFQLDQYTKNEAFKNGKPVTY